MLRESQAGQQAAAPLPVLITGAGAPGTRGTLYSLRHNPDQRPVRVIGVDCRSQCAGRYLVDAFHTAPPPEHLSYLAELVRICRQESVQLVIPQTTREVEALSRRKNLLAQQGIYVMVSDRCAIEVANNKWRLALEFERLNFPIPAHRLARSEDELVAAAALLGYPENPVVVKPPVSNGMRGVRILKKDAWNLDRFLSEKPDGLEISLEDLVGILRRGDRWPELLVSEYLPGPEYSVDAFIGSKAQVAIPRARLAVRSGITFESSLELREDLSRYSVEASRYLGLKYAVGFQFKLDRNGVPKILECNPRVQGTMVASVFSGTNVIWLALRELQGDAPPEIPERFNPGCFYRFWGGISVMGGQVAEI
jgi:carbamoyl-phosphate synthase large subunit